jgi:hypothetical protein
MFLYGLGLAAVLLSFLISFVRYLCSLFNRKIGYIPVHVRVNPTTSEKRDGLPYLEPRECVHLWAEASGESAEPHTSHLLI